MLYPNIMFYEMLKLDISEKIVANNIEKLIVDDLPNKKCRKSPDVNCF